VATINAQEGPAYGAALLALVGTGAYANVPEACAAAIRETEMLSPQPPNKHKYDLLYDVYRRLYAALQDSFPQLGRL